MTTDMTRPGSPAVTQQELAARVTTLPKTWVQTERAAHEAWARLVMSNQRAAAVLHTLIARMGGRNAVAISRGTLAALLGVSEATIKRAVADLKKGSWIETVQLGGKGGVNAYVINSQVAWGESRDNMRFAIFDATIVASSFEQESPNVLEHKNLRKIPIIYADELQLPIGPGEDPPSQQLIEGMEPDLPVSDNPRDRG